MTKTYAEKKLDKGIKFYNRVMYRSNLYIPSDGWLSAERAEKANAAWQTMMNSIQDILYYCAEEKMQRKKVKK